MVASLLIFWEAAEKTMTSKGQEWEFLDLNPTLGKLLSLSVPLSSVVKLGYNNSIYLMKL